VIIIFEVNIVAGQKRTYWWRIICFLQVCIFRNSFTDPLPYRCSDCFLCFM